MNCDDCQEQVFELIELETIDPEAVREVLDRCPQCRGLFDEMKAALANADALPEEEPSAETDARILRAARERAPERVARRRPSWFESTQWAVAAAALLAIGVGVWAIPRGEEVAMDDGSSVRGDTSEMEVAPATYDEADRADIPAQLGSADEDRVTDLGMRVAGREPPAAKSIASPDPMKRKAAREAVIRAEGGAVVAAAPQPAALDAAAGAASAELANDETSAEEARLAPTASKEAKLVSAECQKRISSFDALLDEHGRDAGALLPPEDALRVGRCYEDVGDITRARALYEIAASHTKTKRRALRALRQLPGE